MKVINQIQVEKPLSIVNTKDEEIFTVPEYHMELELEDNSIFILENTDEYYKFIGDAEVCFGSDEIFIDKIFKENYKIILTNDKLENGDTAISVMIGEYNGKDVYLVQVKKE